MRYYKVIENDVLKRIGIGYGGEEISETEYNTLYAEIVKTAANAEPEEPVDELTAEEALEIILGGAV